MAAKGAGNIIICQNTSFGYEGHIVVRGLSFALASGDYLCIAGENGCGKTTLLKGILRLLDPLEGSVWVSPEIQRRETGYLSQMSAAKKDFPASVGEIVLSGMVGGMGLRPFYSRREKERAAETMRRLDILPLKNRCFRELSGGQQRRALIARALCASQTLLVLDEPAAGLDPPSAAELYAVLKKLNSETALSIIMVTHDMQTVVTQAKKILHIGSGGYFFGSTGEYRDSAFGKQFLNNGGGGADDC